MGFACTRGNLGHVLRLCWGERHRRIIEAVNPHLGSAQSDTQSHSTTQEAPLACERGFDPFSRHATWPDARARVVKGSNGPRWPQIGLVRNVQVYSAMAVQCESAGRAWLKGVQYPRDTFFTTMGHQRGQSKAVPAALESVATCYCYIYLGALSNGEGALLGIQTGSWWTSGTAAAPWHQTRGGSCPLHALQAGLQAAGPAALQLKNNTRGYLNFTSSLQSPPSPSPNAEYRQSMRTPRGLTSREKRSSGRVAGSSAARSSMFLSRVPAMLPAGCSSRGLQ